MKPATVMIVENNADLRNTLRHAFEHRGYLTWSCPSSEIAISIFTAIWPDVVLLDLDLEDSDALNLLEAWKSIAPETRVIVEGMNREDARVNLALDLGADAFLLKTRPLPPLFELLKQEDEGPPASEAPIIQAA